VIVGALLLLCYIAVKPLLAERQQEKNTAIPHGTAVQLSNLNLKVYQRIAICIDFSDMDSIAIRSAIAQGGNRAQYVLIHVVETAGAMVYGSEIADQESDKDRLALQNYADQLQQQGFTAEVVVGYGSPKRRIPELANNFHADLIVIGAHGHQFFKDLLFGTTVDGVRHRLKIPMLIVRN
jgi:manganese transport protein